MPSTALNALRRLLPAVAGSVAAVTLLAACGSGSNASSNGAGPHGKDAAIVAQLGAEVTGSLNPDSAQFDYKKYLPTTPVAIKKNARLAVIVSSLASPQAVQFANAVKSAASKVGWAATAFDGQYSPNVESSLISQAVQSKVDGIVIAGVSPSTVSSPIAQARTAHIPVVNMFGYGDGTNGVVDIGSDPKLVGDEVGKWIVVDSGGSAKVAVFELPAGGAASVSIDAYQDSLAAAVGACSACSTLKQIAPITDATAPGTPAYVQFLKNHPEGQLNYIAAGFDTGMINYAKTDQQLGRSEIKTVGGLAGSAAGVAEIMAKSGPVVVPSVPLGFVALACIDAVARGEAGQTASSILLPAPLITSSNASMFPQGVFTPKVDYTAAFAALWKKS